MLITLIGGNRHRDKLEMEGYRRVIETAIIEPLSPIDFRESTVREIPIRTEKYIRREIHFGRLPPIDVYLLDRIDENEWCRNIILDYLK